MRFSDPDLEAEYRRNHVEATCPLHRFGAVAGALGFAAVGLIERKMGVSDGNVDRLLTLRFAVIVPIVLLTLATTYVRDRELYARIQTPSIVVAIVALVVGIAGMAAFVPDPQLFKIEQAVGGAMIIIMGAATFTGLRFAPAVAVLVPSAGVLASTVAVRYPNVAVTSALWLSIATSVALFACYLLESLRRSAWLSTRELAEARDQTERLMRNILPEPIAERLKTQAGPIAEHCAETTVLFADLVGFTKLAGQLSPAQVVVMLDRIFRDFDRLADSFGLEKIKTIGDAYMVVGGAPSPRADHADAVARMALAMVSTIDGDAELSRHGVAIRVGVASGPAVAGVIGTKKPAYDLWGDTVNTASRMESHGLPGKVQLAPSTRERLAASFQMIERGTIDVKGKGTMQTWWLIGEATRSDELLR